METTTTVAPALKALEKVRTEIKKRIGKEGGHLNEKMLSYLGTIEVTLRQIEPLGNMINLINQQTEVAVHGFRALSRVQLQAGDDDNGHDDGTSTTKGE